MDGNGCSPSCASAHTLLIKIYIPKKPPPAGDVLPSCFQQHHLAPNDAAALAAHPHAATALAPGDAAAAVAAAASAVALGTAAADGAAGTGAGATTRMEITLG